MIKKIGAYFLKSLIDFEFLYGKIKHFHENHLPLFAEVAKWAEFLSHFPLPLVFLLKIPLEFYAASKHNGSPNHLA